MQPEDVHNAYPPVNFRRLCSLLTTAGVFEGARRKGCLEGILTQLDLYMPSEQRDNLRQLVTMEMEHDNLLPAVSRALDQWAIDAASYQQRAVFEASIKNTTAGRKGGENRIGIADRDHKRWIDEATRMRTRNKARSVEDMARAIAAEPDETRKPDTIARVLRKAGF